MPTLQIGHYPIENVVTGESFATAVEQVSVDDLKVTTKKNGWLFNWRAEARQSGHQVFKLTTVDNPQVTHGLISLEVKADHMYMHLIESAAFNSGQHKMYAGVSGNLVAYACKLAFDRGHEGYVAFVSKTRLVDHYIASLGAKRTGGHGLVIDTPAALFLINKYFS